MKRIIEILQQLVFWKRNARTQIPREIRTMTQSVHHYEKAAAVKVVKFAKKHFVETEDLNELFQAELEYEKKKYQARHDYPHQEAIRKADIGEAKKRKYERIKIEMNAEAYRKYRSHRSKQKKRYTKKD